MAVLEPLKAIDLVVSLRLLEARKRSTNGWGRTWASVPAHPTPLSGGYGPPGSCGQKAEQ